MFLPNERLHQLAEFADTSRSQTSASDLRESINQQVREIGQLGNKLSHIGERLLNIANHYERLLVELRHLNARPSVNVSNDWSVSYAKPVKLSVTWNAHPQHEESERPGAAADGMRVRHSRLRAEQSNV